MNATAPVPALPLQDRAVVRDLGDDLRAAGYDTAGVPAVLGGSAERALGRGELWPALRATEGSGALHTLIRLQYIHRDSGMVGDGLCQALVRGLPDHLEPGGVAQLLANWMVIGDQDWRVRVAGWLDGSDCDAWVVQRELADPAEYVSLWLSDAGEDREVAAARGRAWPDWFDEQRVTGIGMGVITLRRREPGEHGPVDRVLEEITGAGEEPPARRPPPSWPDVGGWPRPTTRPCCGPDCVWTTRCCSMNGRRPATRGGPRCCGC